jgi:hypothetical protein
MHPRVKVREAKPGIIPEVGEISNAYIGHGAMPGAAASENQGKRAGNAVIAGFAGAD